MSARVRRRLFLFFLLVALAGGAFFAHWWFIGRFYETTDNAYIQADITRVSSELAAKVIDVSVTDNQSVERGDLLAQLDDRDFQIALARAEANLANREAERLEAQSRLAQQDSLIAAAQADVEAKQAERRRIELDITRITPLRQSGYASEEQLSNFRAQLAVAEANIRRAQAELKTQTLAKDILRADIERFAALIQAAQAEVDQAGLDLLRTEIRAPAAGRIGQRSVRPGLNVQPGAHLMAIVPERQMWVQANFKETQIENMHEGLEAILEFDAFPGEEVAGRIDSLFPASGAQFSLLPPENATGNFTKVVQRIPAKILIDDEHPLSRRLRPGMSVTVTVDLRD
ncbi:MAG TPA: HlyD family secretion protein [Pseudomonas xinjiangensis]|uniref:HlyD family secretion protein n=2 Tax=root TaxID=1 RepID=A0A7V1BL86_9GAMM|nr:HlyD family secretion protein [Halopseudomonas xinjiangensis]HEC47398.1 HlyD family secretion protein [Halopseudomonas xinjiangensis]